MHRLPPEPPDYDHVWVSPVWVAELLGVTRQAVGRAAREDRLPGVRHEGRWWFRRDQVEVIAAG